MNIKLINYGGIMPVRKHINDVGADVYTKNYEYILPHSTVKVPLGFGIILPENYAAFVYPRSSISALSIGVQLPPIDPGYTGEIHAIITNYSSEKVCFDQHSRIGQLVVIPFINANFEWAKPNEIPESDRGVNAFGSTGIF